jgi:hypothetical protein
LTALFIIDLPTASKALHSMDELYFRLFHASSSERDRLEDFLVEIVGDLLNRLPKKEQLSFCDSFLLRDCPLSQKRRWLTRADECDNLQWKTQVLIAVSGANHLKRPDIVLYGDDKPLMIVECKIGAGFTGGKLMGDGGGRPSWVDQLTFYDHWLASMRPAEKAALVLLTHLCKPPSQFLSDGGAYRTALRSVRSWADLYKWLTKEKGAMHWSTIAPRAAVLIDSFIHLMKEKQLMNDSPTPNDFAAARLYLCGGAHNRMVEAMAEARKLVQNRFSNLKGFPNKPPDAYSEPADGSLMDWCELSNGPAIVWGIYFTREDSDFWIDLDPPVKFREGVFLEIEFKRIVLRPKSKFSSWHFPQEVLKNPRADNAFYVSKTAPFSEFGDEFTSGFSAWVADSFDEAKYLIATA